MKWGIRNFFIFKERKKYLCLSCLLSRKHGGSKFLLSDTGRLRFLDDLNRQLSIGFTIPIVRVWRDIIGKTIVEFSGRVLCAG